LDTLQTQLRGHQLLARPTSNKGRPSAAKERQRWGFDGLLPLAVENPWS